MRSFTLLVALSGAGLGSLVPQAGDKQHQMYRAIQAGADLDLSKGLRITPLPRIDERCPGSTVLLLSLTTI